MPHVPNYRIIDLPSFQQATSEPRQTAGLYFYQVLDSLCEMAYAISLDFRRRPQLYRDLGQPPLAPLLAQLAAQYGTQVNVLSLRQRGDIYAPLFGTTDGDSFARLRDDVIRACKAFAERSADTGIDMLREVVRTAHRPFKDYLTGLQGDSVRFSKDVALSDFTEKTCYPILRSAAVAAVFGVAKLAAGSYPYATDAAEDILIEAISARLRGLNGSTIVLTRERISSLQRVALRGAEAIATAIDFEEADHDQTDADLDLLIGKCYSWGAALATIKTQNDGCACTVQAAPPMCRGPVVNRGPAVNRGPVVNRGPAVNRGPMVNRGPCTPTRPILPSSVAKTPQSGDWPAA
jgi:hypothetical protein